MSKLSDKADKIMKGARVNYPHPIESGQRIVGWKVPSDWSGPGTIAALREIEEAARYATKE